MIALGVSLASVPIWANGVSFSPLSLFSASEPGAWLDPSDLSTLFQDAAGTTPVTAPGQSVGLVLDKSRGSLAPRRNLYRYSQTMTNTNWGQNRTTVASSGTTSTPRGVLPYFKVTATGNDPQLIQYVTTGPVANRTFTLSFVAWTDAGQPTEAALFFFGTTGVEQVTTVNITLTTTPTVYTLTGSFTGTAASSTVTARIDLKEIPTIGDYIYVTAAQFEEGAYASAYQETADFPVAWIGNHATQATAAARPVYGVVPSRGLVNLVPATNNLAAAGWNKGSCSVVGDKIIPNTSVAQHLVYTSHSAVLSASNQAYTFAADFKADGMTTATLHIQGQSPSYRCAWQINLAAGIISSTGGTAGSTNIGQSITPLGDGWYHVVVTGIPQSEAVTGAAVGVFVPTEPAIAGDGVSGIRMRNENFVVGSVEGVFQHVVSKYEVIDPVGFPSYPCHYLSFDGVDDFLVTPTITPGIDKVQVFAGVRKLSDAASAMVAELGADAVSGAFALQAPEATTFLYRWLSRGSLAAQVRLTGSSYAAPQTAVLTGIGDISGDVSRIRFNGRIGSEVLTDQGTGNYLAYPLYIGRRGGTTLPFNGRIYGLITRFGANLTDDQITRTETWMNSKTGAY